MAPVNGKRGVRGITSLISIIPPPPPPSFPFQEPSVSSSPSHVSHGPLHPLLAACYGHRIALSLSNHGVVNPGVILAPSAVLLALLQLMVEEFEHLPAGCVRLDGSEEAVANHLLRSGADGIVCSGAVMCSDVQ